MISFDTKRFFSTGRQKNVTGIRVSQLWIVSILLTALITAFTIAVRIQPTASATSVTPESIPVAKVVQSTTAPAPTEAATTPTKPATAQSAAPASCAPANANAQPTAINLSATESGLTKLIDTPVYYRIFGNTSAQIQAQLHACAPHATNGETFAGEAGYTLTWQYTPSTTSNGLCILGNVKVGLHVSMTLPTWSATPQAASGLANKWSNFITNLTHHENGHVALDTQYASQLLSDLQNYPATDCTTLHASVQTKANGILASLDAANIAYDDHTDHGATQGAILP